MKFERPRAKRADEKRGEKRGEAGGSARKQNKSEAGGAARKQNKSAAGGAARKQNKSEAGGAARKQNKSEKHPERKRVDSERSERRGQGQRGESTRGDRARGGSARGARPRGERPHPEKPRSEPRRGEGGRGEGKRNEPRRGEGRHAQGQRAEGAWSEGRKQPPSRGKRPPQAGAAARPFGEARTSNRRAERAAFAERRKKGTRPAGEFHDDNHVRGPGDWDAPQAPARDARPERAKPVSGELDKARLERVPYPKIPRAISQLKGDPHPGLWLLTTREGSEQDLVDELLLGQVVDPAPRVFAPGLVLSPKVPKRDKRPIDLTFARQGFEILTSVQAHDLDELTNRVERSLRNKLASASTYALHVWVPDTTIANPLSGLAEELETRLAERLAVSLPKAKRVDDSSLRRLGSMPFAQVCVIDPERAVAGVMHSNATPSLARGGRTRVRVSSDAPSRAARKLEEALAWLGVEPGPGEVCVDLGAAPGGWTYVLAERRARVIAVDPAKLRPDILAKKGVRHLQESAFTFTPEEPIDWLFCDMAWRPLEAAALLAKWGRKRWARMIVANIKLPMTKKAEILARVRAILETEGEWNGLRFKQLYHDRDEITLTAHRA